VTAVLVGLVLGLVGCNRGLNTSYGPSKGILAKRSINGFSTFRDAFESAGFDHREINRLTDRARRASVIVWTPPTPTGIETKTTRWFERWMKMGSKTLIFVIPDSGSESVFYRDARPLAEPDQRLEYRRKYAESLVAEHQWQMHRIPLPSNGWFSASPKVQESHFELSDKAKSSDFSWVDTSAETEPRRFEWVIEEYDKKKTAQQGVPRQGMVIWDATGPGGTPWGSDHAVSPTSSWIEFEPVFQSQSGDTLVARVTSDSWNGSQILVVAGGSTMTNYGLIGAENQRLADQLIDSSLQTLIDGNVIDPELQLAAGGEAPLVGFSVANGAFPISEANGELPRTSGAELLTAFPISFVTIHIALLGFVICLMLFPVFGRPRQIDRGVLTHFGDHLDAVATLMRRRGGEAFAKRRISDYMRQVRDEVSGPWVIDEPKFPPSGSLLQTGDATGHDTGDAAGRDTGRGEKEPDERDSSDRTKTEIESKNHSNE
jgi:hypothetical protein